MKWAFLFLFLIFLNHPGVADAGEDFKVKQAIAYFDLQAVDVSRASEDILTFYYQQGLDRTLVLRGDDPFTPDDYLHFTDLWRVAMQGRDFRPIGKINDQSEFLKFYQSEFSAEFERRSKRSSVTTISEKFRVLFDAIKKVEAQYWFMQDLFHNGREVLPGPEHIDRGGDTPDQKKSFQDWMKTEFHTQILEDSRKEFFSRFQSYIKAETEGGHLLRIADIRFTENSFQNPNYLSSEVVDRGLKDLKISMRLGHRDLQSESAIYRRLKELVTLTTFFHKMSTILSEDSLRSEIVFPWVQEIYSVLGAEKRPLSDSPAGRLKKAFERILRDLSKGDPTVQVPESFVILNFFQRDMMQELNWPAETSIRRVNVYSLARNIIFRELRSQPNGDQFMDSVVTAFRRYDSKNLRHRNTSEYIQNSLDLESWVSREAEFDSLHPITRKHVNSDLLDQLMNGYIRELRLSLLDDEQIESLKVMIRRYEALSPIIPKTRACMIHSVPLDFSTGGSRYDPEDFGIINLFLK